jgi:GNAT superfamily N-acetyltransferase
MNYKRGERVEYTITYLEMMARPGYPRPHVPPGPVAALVAAARPPAWYFLALYDAVGRDHEWTDQHDLPNSEIEAFLHHADTTLYSFVRAGWPNGFFVLDCRKEAVCHLAYFGLVPQAIGQGLGRFLIQTAVHMAWDRPGVERVTVNTNTLDHPRALPLYQRAGFEPVRRETRSRVLTRDRDSIGA